MDQYKEYQKSFSEFINEHALPEDRKKILSLVGQEKDDPIFGFRCWLFFHRWGRWFDSTLSDSRHGSYLGQMRYCVRCNKKQVIRTIVFNG